ncbi:MAG: CHASE2 domain-containing protein [Deltaproteobacteria bacterium]
MNTNRAYKIRIAALVAGSFLIASLLFLLLPSVFSVWNLQTNDQLFQLRYKLFGRQEIYPHIAHVDLNDSSLQELRGFPWDRTLYGRITDILSKGGAETITYDILFQRPSAQESDSYFIEATERAKTVYFPVVLALEEYGGVSAPPALSPQEQALMDETLWRPRDFGGGESMLAAKGAYPTFPDLAKFAKGVGHITAYPDADGVYRRFALLIRYGDGYAPSLTFRMVCDYLGVPPERIELSRGRITLRGAKFPDGGVRDVAIPVDGRGRMILNFAGTWNDSFKHYSFSALLGAEGDAAALDELREVMQGDLAIVADVSTGAGDIGPIPLENAYPLSGVHANIANTVLTENFLSELSPAWSALADVGLIVFLVLFALRFRAARFSICALLLFVVFAASVVWLFLHQNTLTNAVRPSLGFIFALVSVNAYRYLAEEREKAYLRRMFENYFAPGVLNKILKSPEKLMASERKSLTVLFSDISGFTSWSTTQEPEQIRLTLNEYFDEMAKIVFKHEGTIDKFIGDGLMVFFGDPVHQPDHALRAVRAAIEMQQKTRRLRRRWEAEGRLAIKIRVGINTGDVVVGNMGSLKRMDYTVIGANVNLAQRLESVAPVEGILVSEPVFERVKDFVSARCAGSITAKGISQGFVVYEIAVPED